MYQYDSIKYQNDGRRTRVIYNIKKKHSPLRCPELRRLHMVNFGLENGSLGELQ